MPDAFQPHHRRIIELAVEALTAKIHDDEPTATNAVRDLVDLDPHNAVQLAVMTWIDATCRLLGWDRREKPVTPPPMVIVGEAAEQDLSELEPGLIWTSQIFHARATMNADAFYELLTQVDSREKLRWVELLLVSCASTVICARQGNRQRMALLN